MLYALDGNAAFPRLVLMSRKAARRGKATGVEPALSRGLAFFLEKK
ncbi:MULTISPECIES: hypothetical protein [unclassified Janthinobacterium]|nr:MULTISPECIES: hypothetical protein [unclassified Janthinobacterium]MEC5162049.1 hypothetical protein [Janthinobacterium sp. CG_S6]